ncbi:MAG: TonB family protein [Bacteroidetes bacterium]|nr:TonB family protein [Bacteroidota bacterium]
MTYLYGVSFCRMSNLLGAFVLLMLADVKPATGQSTPTPATDTVVVADEAPKLIGGMRALMKEVRYPTAAKRRGIEGRVFVQFVVTTEGKPVNIEVVRGAHRHLDRAAVDAVKKVTFEPGILDGEPTNVVMSLPVTFQLGR